MGSSYPILPLTPSRLTARPLFHQFGRRDEKMLDLSSTDVWPSTLQKIGMWAKQPCIKEGYLPLFDAACLMSEHGYGGIYKDCSKYTQNEIEGILEFLQRSIDVNGLLEGYAPTSRFVNGKNQDVYPLIAYRTWMNRTGYGDGQYFKNTNTLSEKSVPVVRSIQTESVSVDSEIPFGICESDMAETVEEQFEDDELLAEVIEQREPTFTIQQAVINMFGLDKARQYFDDFDQQYRFTGVPDACESAMLQSVNRQKELVTFMGYECVNPFDVMDNYKVTFPREAYYQWWKANPHGMPCPKWFEDLRKDDEARLLDEAENVEVASFDDVETDEPSKAVGITGRLDEAIRLGRSTERVLELIQSWLKRPDERKGSETEWRKTLFDSIEFNAKKEGWGLHKKGGLSETQWKAFELIFLPEPTGSGRGSKSWGGKYSFNDLKAK